MVRFGVIGTNTITKELIKAGREIHDFELRAIYSRTQEQADSFAKQYDIEHTFTDLSSMAQSKEIDAVYIASPNALHAKQAILCMNHQKHVLCEKPIASNTTELQAMIQVAKDNHVVLMEAVKGTFFPTFQAIRENLHKLGPVRRYFASYCKYSSRYDAYKEGTILNAFKPELSNGSLMDIGIYCIYPMVVLFGKPEKILANGFLLDSGVDGDGSILFHYGQMDAMVVFSKITNSYLPAEIQGEDATMVIDKINQPRKVELRFNNGTIEDISVPVNHHSMYYELVEFINLVKQEGKLQSSVNSYLNSQLVMEIMDEARSQMGLVFPADK
jgi:scyllo-inositol 2-dehydrogenase (NADP+)